MSTELIGILNLVVVLAALTLGTLRGLRTEMRSDLGAVRGELRGDILAYDDRLRALDDRIRMQEQSTARLEGQREAVAVHAGPWPAPADPPCAFAQCCRRRYPARPERS